MLDTVLHGVAVVGLALILGGMVFFAAVTAPTVFKALEAEPAGRFLRAIFPAYHLYMGVISLAAGAALAKRDIYSGLAVLGICALFAWSRQILTPRINSARDASLSGDEAAAERFKQLHRVSVLINLFQMLFVAAVFAKTAL